MRNLIPARAFGRIRQRRAGGFTLIEVLAALVLVGIVLPLVMQAVTLSLHAASSARHRAEAAQLAELKLNEILVLRDAALVNSYGDFGEAWPQYRWQTTAVAWENAVYEVSVTVTWEERGHERALSMATLVYTANRELEW